MIFDVQFTNDEDVILDEPQIEADDLYECMRRVLEGHKWPDGTANICVWAAR